MNEPTSIIVSDRPWNADMPRRLAERRAARFVLLDRQENLTSERLAELTPRYVFFPHWSYRIPRAIYENHECIIFHMTDVPYGRGGSPLQNLILRGHTETVVTALRCVKEIDAGPVYLKRPLSLFGTAEEIFLRAAEVMENMIVEIIQTAPVPLPQEGEPVAFKRLGSEAGDLNQAESLEAAFDRIRMLDAEGYPPAFIEAGGFRLEFRRPSRHADYLESDVTIKRIERN